MPSDHPAHRFCSRCAQPLAVRILKPGEPERPVCDACGHVVYLDPKVAVGTIIRGVKSKIVLLRRAIEPGYGKWVFPGGYVDRGEELRAAAQREAWEEARLRIHIDGLINVYSYPGWVPVIIVYAATHVSGVVATDEESLDARWFSEADIPWQELAFPSTTEGLRDYFRRTSIPTGP